MRVSDGRRGRGGSVEGVWGVLMAYVGMDEDQMEGEGGSSHLNKLVFIYFIASLVLLNCPTSKPSTLFSDLEIFCTQVTT